ncbi:YcsE-related riboflavin metabolism phosphatase [Mesomycoplasma neurolyticum]|uniref:Cof-like hydrolase n=1 Tax=Mesomycoplasma neurolyticum TaxID=2120 RepID=A0A449A5G6_9BACT|nr:HAD family hydrolase [Mesomycoplasma neurolyticum]VEU59464.1 Cof-like hydrolase [Mesomycoplasma neurolyticum]
MKKYKLIVFDIDGTLLPFGVESLSAKTKKMVHELKEKGYVVVFATGREFVTIGTLLDDIPVDYFIGANGAFIYDLNKKEVVFENKIILSEFQTLSNFLEKFNCEYSVMTDKWGYFSDGHDLDTWFLSPHKENFKNLCELTCDEEPLHLVTIRANDKSFKNTVQEFIDKNNLNMEINAQWSKGFFIGPKNTNKATGLKKLYKFTKITLDEMIAFGDSSNDVEMLSEVGYSVALAGGWSYLKTIAKDVTTKTVEEDGVYYKLKELGIL